jgi:hypothetical protein
MMASAAIGRKALFMMLSSDFVWSAIRYSLFARGSSPPLGAKSGKRMPKSVDDNASAVLKEMKGIMSRLLTTATPTTALVICVTVVFLPL